VVPIYGGTRVAASRVFTDETAFERREKHMHKLMTLLALAVVLGTSLSQASPAGAQSGQRCFPETGQCISGPIRAYWEQGGGLAVFGYPTTPQQQEIVEGRTLQVQWFERDRLEIQLDGSITAGRLGARLLEIQGRPWVFGNEGPRPGRALCTLYGETGYNLCPPFSNYWRENGGLERFGFPITSPFLEQIEGQTYMVQYFERRRMEIHPELPGSPILLGLLGNEVRALGDTPTGTPYPPCLQNTSEAFRMAYNRAWFRGVLGCPVLYAPTDMPAAIQQFQNGEMIWFGPPQVRVPGGVLTPTVVAYYQPPWGSAPEFQRFSDTWQEGRDPETPEVTVPEGLFAPRRGFGKVWIDNADVRNRIGWAVQEREQARRADYQILERGLMVRIYEPGTAGVVYIFGDPSDPAQVQKVQL
jgi:hypothetical protein